MLMSPEETDNLFRDTLILAVKKHPDWEMDQLVAHLVGTGFPRPYVDGHLQAIYAAMMRGQELSSRG
jgi:hypothetical protein